MKQTTEHKTPHIAESSDAHAASAHFAGIAIAPPAYGLDVVDRHRLDSMQSELVVQAKLTIGAPDDQYEREADRVAAQVVQRLHEPAGSTLQQSQPIQRQATPEEAEKLQRKPAEGSMAAPPVLESSIQQLRGRGQPLTEQVRQPMEQAFGADFSGVRIHTDAQADQLNRTIQAKAFTTGRDVFFRQGAYQPSSRGGQAVLAHELTHVVQQNGGAVMRSTKPPQRFPQPSATTKQTATVEDRDSQGKGDNVENARVASTAKTVAPLLTERVSARNTSSIERVVQRVTASNSDHWNTETHEDAKALAYKRKSCKPANLAQRARDLGVPTGGKLVVDMRGTDSALKKFFIIVVGYTAGATIATDHIEYVTAYFSPKRAARGELNSTYESIA